MIARKLEWIVKLIEEFHVTPLVGQVGAFRTYKRLAASVYWPGMMRQVTEYVAASGVF